MTAAPPDASIPATPPRPFDSEAADRLVDRWLELAALEEGNPARGDAVRTLARSTEGLALLRAVGGNSPYLSQLVVREPDTVLSFVADGPEAAFTGIVGNLNDTTRPEHSIDAVMTGLRVAKRRAALLIALADITGRWSVERVTRALSEVAEIGLRLAVDHLLIRAYESGALTRPRDGFAEEGPGRGSGLIILAMGKLGARELNYSSDIDIIVFYDDAVAPVADPDRMGRVFTRMARDLVRIMDERTKDGYVFRTDLRLRPDPGATPPAVSVSAAEIYYASVGQNWERAAMIKARPIAGDIAAGDAFLATLRRFIWRQHLDFAAIRDIHAIKRQINAHKGHREIRVNGHDVKVGRGGIREIEFFAQTQQLIFGGRDDSVRVRPTLAAIRALAASGRVPTEAVTELSAAYAFLRRVEHRIQMIDDQQTHKVPESEEGVAHLAAFLGYADADTFRAELLATMGVVEDRYAELFEDAPDLAPAGNLVFTGTDDDPATLATLAEMGFAEPSRVIAIVSGWHRGRYRSTRANRARELLTELVPTLLRELAGTGAPDAALLNMDGFLERLPAGVAVFSLFHANPWLLRLMAEIMGGTPRLADILSRHPALLDAVLSTDFLDPLSRLDELRRDHARALAVAGMDGDLDDKRLEDALTVARRWTNDQRFRAGVHLLRGISDGDRCGPFLADLAQVALDDIAGRVEAALAARHGRFEGGSWVIVAMGKLGSRELTITSDIDLIVVYETPEDATHSDGDRPLSPAEYHGRLTQRLISAITAQMADGPLYEVDMRLRPSGNAGPLATSLTAFTTYQAKDAWTWEHMALTRARVIRGDKVLTEKVEAVIHDALTTRRDPDTLLFDVADMRRRIAKEFPADSVWKLKHARGGLIDIEFIAQYLQLRHGGARPDLLSVNMADTLAHAGTLGYIAPEAAATLTATLRMWRRVQGYVRLTGEEAVASGAVSPAVLAGIARAAFPEDAPPVDFAELDAKVSAVAASAYRWFQVIIEEPASRLPPREESTAPVS